MTTLEAFWSGSIPETLEAKTAAAGELVTVSRRIVPVTSLLIAAARRDHFRKDTYSWVQWCRDNVGLEGGDRDHRRAIGDMLLDMRDKEDKVYRRLWGLSMDKLLCLTRIPTDQLPAFLSHHNAETMTREEVRMAVCSWLGEEVKEKAVQPDLPGFAAAVDAICSMAPDALVSRVADAPGAAAALKASMGLLGASLSYHKRHPDVLTLQSVRASLLDEVKEVEGLISEAGAE